MIVNSELPCCLFDENNTLNDYDFVLFHLYKTNEKYKEYFLKQRKTHPNRLMILDNSAYEFYVKGEELNLDDYHDAIIELNPDYYILPDKLMDYSETAYKVAWFLNNYKTLNSNPIGVIQGESVGQLMKCIQEYKQLGIKSIAIPFHLSLFIDYESCCYEDVDYDFYEKFQTITQDSKYAIGRIKFLRDYGSCLLADFDYIHILGSHNPYEKIYYKDFQSMDTGYPVKCGITGYELFKEPCKPNVIIDDFFEKDLNPDIKNLISLNVTKFKNLK